MCGIIGICGLSSASRIAEEDFVRARDTMQTRGPDAAGYVTFGDGVGGICHFGHRRLSIRDLSDNGNQPMHSGSGRFTIVYNGEVYNTKALRRALTAEGCRLRSRSDTEVVLEGFEKWGEGVVERLNGMFAFGVWDHEQHRLFLTRDRMGIKPLYVARSGHAIAFSSDARALRALGLGGEIDREALALYLVLGYVPAPRSIWEGIEKLDAGNSLTWNPKGNVRKTCYWKAPEDTDFEGREARIVDLIDEVVEEHLLSDVPLGLFLSGGLDSSVVASSVANLGRSTLDVTALTVSFPNASTGDEAAVAERTARALGLEIRVLNASHGSAAYYDSAAAAMDEPLAFSAVASQAAISQMAANAGLKAVLTGDGGDEVFGGYRWYGSRLATPAATVKPRAMLSDLWRLIGARERRRQVEQGRDREYHKKSDLFAHASSVLAAFRPDQVGNLMLDITAEETEDLILGALARHDAPNLPEKRRRQRIDLYTFCQDVVLPKVDRQGMAFSLEVRPPLLDHRIVEWGLSRPVTHGFEKAPKNILRTIIRKRGLEFLLEEPKRGFSFRGRLGPGRKSKLEVVRSSLRGLGFRQEWEEALQRHTPRYGNQVDILYWLSNWNRLHDEPDSAA